jgi:ABC-type lipopolysaccharide export system ATPase subunit
VANWVYVLVAGQVEAQGSPEQIGDRRDIGRMFLGAGGHAGGEVEGATAK